MRAQSHTPTSRCIQLNAEWKYVSSTRVTEQCSLTNRIMRGEYAAEADMVEAPLIRFMISMVVINGKDRICSTTNTQHTSRIDTMQTRLSHELSRSAITYVIATS